MPQTAARLHLFPESVISEMSKLAALYNAINLSSGYPDFEPPDELLAAAQQALRSGYNQYADSRGSSRFRQALARKQTHFMGMEIDPHAHIIATCGGTEAMLLALLAVCNPGDKAIVFSPFYETYGPDLYLAGAEPLIVSLQPPDFSLNTDELRRAFRLGARALILCNPSNPSGKVFTPAELHVIADLAQEYDAFVITDDVYEHIVYKPHQHTYISTLPGMFERTLVCGSLSKTYSITGWRLGYVLASAPITAAIHKLHTYINLSTPAPLLEAAATALSFPYSYYDQLLADYTHRRDLLLGYLAEAGLAYIEPQGAYFVLVDISPTNFDDDVAFCHWLIKEIGIAAVPGSSFFHEPVKNMIRLNFAKKEPTLIEAGWRLLRIKERI
ncbi:MAG TPA: aminotransferase class I/II-fold pyridoxal phosphate-dependent enzyme [Anaerolineales bacterium]|nr:aminotransferase class I/II-fold pyridoxal phosphate-dependent enzyme [Anaerolineales bacterium]